MRDGARPALIHGGVSGDGGVAGAGVWAPGAVLSYADLAVAVAGACERLSRCGVAPGVRVAVLARSTLGAFLALHALLAIGAVVVPLHPRLTEVEAATLLEDAQPALVLRDADLVALEALVGAPGGPAPAPPGPAPEADADLAIVYTSGTTGRPKGAVLTRRAFAAAAAASAENLGVREDDRWLLCLPLCHVGGVSIVTRCLLARRAVVLLPRFDAAAVLESIARDRATLLSVVPTMLLALLEIDRGNVLSRLRAVLVGGAGAPERVLEECARRGVPALTTYGLTEACSQVTSQGPRDPRARAPGSGRPLAGVAVRIAGAGEDGAGRIEIRSPALSRGYFRGPGAPAAPLAGAEGWFDTGDVGRLDAAGRLHVLARRTDLVVTGGENVYPAEVERALEACDGVARAVVFGVPDARWGQIVAAAIVPASGAPSGPAPLPPELAAAVVAGVSARLAPHKRPRQACAVGELPLTPGGKPDRAGAAARVAAALAPLPRPGGEAGAPGKRRGGRRS